jgi:hypothetical protein
MVEESKKMIKVTEDKLTEVVGELRELVVRSPQRVWIGGNKKVVQVDARAKSNDFQESEELNKAEAALYEANI